MSTVYGIRVDHKIGDRDSAFARYTDNNVSSVSATSHLPIATVGSMKIDPQSGFAGLAPQIARNAQVNYAHTLTPQLLFTLGAGYLYVNNQSQSLNYGMNPNTAFGQANLNIDQSTSGLAYATVTGATNLGNGGYFVPLMEKDNVYQLSSAVMYSVGRHSLKGGGTLIAVTLLCCRTMRVRETGHSPRACRAWSVASIPT
ncbi:MAG: hypothetical protein P4K86_04890 [Terracidiphilus sp.]|nr:hypothetical protein [Terracidiphilus sp.]